MGGRYNNTGSIALPITLEESRDALLKSMRINEKDPDKRSAYVDGVLDFYNAMKAEEKNDKPV